LRALFYDPQTKVVRTPPINKFYTTLLIYERTNAAIASRINDDEQMWIDILLKKMNIHDIDEYYASPFIDPTIIEYDIKASKYQYYVNVIYQSYYDELSGKKGLIRGSVLGKNVDFSARAVIRCDPSLPTYQIKVSKDILYTLWKPHFMYYMTRIRGLEYDYCYDEFMQSDKSKEQFQEFLDWFCENEDETIQLYRLVFLNRPPTLWAHSIPVVEIVPEDNDYTTIALSPPILEMMNADLDGDQLALYYVHDVESLKQMKENAFVKNITHYQSDNRILSSIRHEALYGAYVLSTQISCNDKPIIELENLQTLPESDELYDNNLNQPVKFNDNIYPYGLCLLNKWCGFVDDIEIDFIIDKKTSRKISEKILKDSETSAIYYDRLTDLSKKLMYFISSTSHTPSMNIDDMLEFVNDKHKQMFKNLPKQNIMVGYCVNKALVEKCIESCSNTNKLLNVYKSGSRVNANQLAKICINAGYVSDDNNKIIKSPIKSNLLIGFTEEEFFRGAPGSRKGIGDKSKATPDSGYMERSLAMALSPLEIDMDDCCTTNYLKIHVINENHAYSLVGKNYVIDNNSGTFDLETAISFIGKDVYIRSPITCINPKFKMCKKCFGERNFVSQYVGIIAAQSISERLTQLTMQTFHTSGAANINVKKEIISFMKNHLVDIELNDNKILCHFNNDDFPEEIYNLNGFEKKDGTTLIYNDNYYEIYNDDVISIINGVNQLLITKETTRKYTVEHPSVYYQKMMEYILSVGTPYSSFVEMIFANMFLTNNKNDPVEFWRYNQNKKITKKLNDKSIAVNIDPFLGALFQPNRKTLPNFNFEISEQTDMNVYFKLCYGRLI
jgi:hypothetical protein